MEMASLPHRMVMEAVPQRANWATSYSDYGIGGRFKKRDLNAAVRDDAKSKVAAAFHEALRIGAVVAMGHEEEGAALKSERQGQPAPAIAPKEWSALRIFRNEAKQGRAVVYYGLRFLPLLHSPLAAEMLAGLTMREAFTRFVVGDPELIAVCEVEDLEPLVVAFSEVAGNSVVHAVAGQRKQALLGLLRSGALVAYGVDSKGEAIALEPSRWGVEGALARSLAGSDVDLILALRSEDIPQDQLPSTARAELDERVIQIEGIGTIPVSARGDSFSRKVTVGLYVARAFRVNAGWKERGGERGFFENVARAIRKHVKNWGQEGLADALRKQWKELCDSTSETKVASRSGAGATIYPIKR
jgi:hypothetical protein